jgi:catechol 2,3-dioxygenase-like lactoylglutathione lyase family enzyme
MTAITKTRFVIAVPDLKASSAFYRDVLGFKIDPISDPGWLFYTLGDCTIMAGECPDAIPPSELGDHSYFAYMEVDDIDPFYRLVAAAGAKICKTIRSEPWG